MKSPFGICQLAVVPMRAEASDRSEILSQLLFGDLVRVITLEEKWVFIQSLYDDYLGWIDVKHYVSLSEEDYERWQTRYVTGTGITALERADGGLPLQVLPGSSIPVPAGESFDIGGITYIAPTSIIQPDRADFPGKLEEYSRAYLNAPYLWGGRGTFGIDCSGFSQIVYKMLGVSIPRDAAQQALKGEVVHFLAEAQPGDLAFFDNPEARIIHVGILLDQEHVIHASGRVKIDKIDSEGIYSEELGKHTHRLRVIKRFV